MVGFEITWVHDPVADILEIGSISEACAEFVCGTYCDKNTPDSCHVYCTGYAG